MLAKIERVRKAVVGPASIVVAYTAVALDVLGRSNLSTKDGVFAAVLALGIGLITYKVPNKS